MPAGGLTMTTYSATKGLSHFPSELADVDLEVAAARAWNISPAMLRAGQDNLLVVQREGIAGGGGALVVLEEVRLELLRYEAAARL